MTLVAVDDSLPPSPRRHRLPRLIAEPVRVRTRLKICQEWSEHFRLPTGDLALIEHLLVTRTAWRKDQRSQDRRWRWVSNGFLVIAYRIHW